MTADFLSYIAHEKRYSKHTLISYQNDLRQFSEYLHEEYELDYPQEATYPMIRSWIAYLAEGDKLTGRDPLVAKSLNRKIACLRTYYHYLIQSQKIKKDPMLKIRAPKVKKSLPHFVAQEDMNHLLDGYMDHQEFIQLFAEDFDGQRDKLIFELLYGTGIRLSELIEARWRDVSITGRTLKVLGKGNKERIVPLNTTLFQLMQHTLELRKTQEGGNQNDFIIVTNEGNKVYPMFVYRVVREFLAKLPGNKIEKKSPHVLRHTFATHLLDKGADLNAIKDLLGHSSLAATQVYTHNSLEKLKAIFEQAHPRS